MKYLLDTNTCVALLRDRSVAVARKFQAATAHDNTVAISSLVACELWYGVYKSARQQENSDALLRFLRGPIQVIPFDEEDAHTAGAVRAELARTGKTIGSYDTLIAGQCLSKSWTVVTSNLAEFRRIKNLRCEDWAT
jgi:tRNA(fMet)-specific endonuclease VapC